jgi:hypothetical protein
MDITIDGNPATWGPDLDVCGTIGASRGFHRLELTATDNAGNSSFLSRLFFCLGPDAAKAKNKH